jgi:pilus assembly protein TadC
VLYFGALKSLLREHTVKQSSEKNLPLPDKKIPTSVMIIGTFEVAVALFGLIILVLIASFSLYSLAFLVMLLIYGAMGAGLLAIQEWARRINVILHMIAVPYALYTSRFLGSPTGWQLMSQLVISTGIVLLLSRPVIRYKFQTVVPRRK